MDRRNPKYPWCVYVLALAVAGILAQAISAADTLPASPHDTRVERLKTFFEAYHCPAPLLVSEYVAAADAYGLDYRLLPALSVRESTCGQYARLNNRWGWDSANTGFATLQHGIRFIARQLALGKYYQGKSLDEKLRAYNPNPKYPAEIRKLMREIDGD